MVSQNQNNQDNRLSADLIQKSQSLIATPIISKNSIIGKLTNLRRLFVLGPGQGFEIASTRRIMHSIVEVDETIVNDTTLQEQEDNHSSHHSSDFDEDYINNDQHA